MSTEEKIIRPEKVASVAELKERIQGSEIAIVTSYQGINVDAVNSLRKKMREAGVEYKVYKNTLATIALQELGLESAAQYINGPTAWAFCGDPVTPAKILKDVGATNKFVIMNGGVLNGKVVSGAQLVALASLPSRHVLLGQVVGTIAMPLQNLLGTLNALPRNLVNVLDQIKKQKEAA